MKTKRYSVQTSGRYVRELLYTQPLRTDSPALRAQKRQVSDEGRRWMNQRQSYRKLAGVLAANFEHDGLFVTLTYDDAHIPKTRKDAIKAVRRFLVQLRAAYQAEGRELRYVYVTETLHGAGRIHHHLCITGRMTDGDLIRRLWQNGSNFDFRPVRLDNAEKTAQYMTKEPRNGRSPVGARTWTPSLNLYRPCSESCMVDESYAIQPPVGAFVFRNEVRVNMWGTFTYLEYVLPPDAVPQFQRPSRRRVKN